ncbi:MAG: universal stress protein [Salinigranum sp.]
MYEDILVPTDGSDAAEAAVDHAVELATTYGARLHALYVVDSSAYAMVDAGGDVIHETLEQEGEAAVGRVADRANEAGLTALTVVTTGTPSRDILAYADENGVDLIVMGTHGRRGLERYLLGSVTERVVRGSDVPVLTVHGAPAEEE